MKEYEDETNKILEQIKYICQKIDSSNKIEVDIYLNEIIDLCNKLIIK